MKKKFTFLIAALLLLTMISQPTRLWGQEKTDNNVYTLAITKNTSNSGYANYYDIEVASIGWKAPGNQSLGAYIKIGGKLTSATDRYLYSKTAISGNINKVIVTHGTKDSQITVNSMTLKVYSTAADAADDKDPIATISGTYADGSSTTFTKPNNDDWSGCFYRINYNLSSSASSKNYGIIFTKAEFYTTTFTLTYSATNGDISGVLYGTTTTVSSGGSVNKGGKVTLTANPESGYSFYNWSVSGENSTLSSTTTNPTTFTMGTDNAIVTATFVSAGDYITVSPTTANVACAGDDVEFTVDTDQTLDANPVVFYTTSTGDVSTTKPSWIGDLTSAYSSSTLTIPVTANTGAARTAYFRVEKGSVKSDVITINQAVYAPAAPTLPAADNFDYTKEITITVPDGTTVYYTLDGTDPTSSSTGYSAPFTINATKTVKAVAYNNGYPSAVVSATYTRTYDYISSISSTSTNYTVKGTVVATNTKGFVFGDATGYIYDFYATSIPSVGSVVSITNQKVSTYGKVYEFKTASASASNSTYNSSDTPTSIDGDYMYTVMNGSTNYISNYQQFVGTLTKSGSNYFFEVDGTTHTSNAMISYPTDDQSDDLDDFDGEIVKVNGYFAGVATVSSTNYYSVMLESVEACPLVTTSVSSISNFTYNVGGGPDAKSFTVSGANLTDDITVSTNSANFEISSDNSNWQTSDITISKGSGTVAATTIYVRLKSGLDSNTYNGKITVASEGATSKEIALTGTVKHTIAISGSITNGSVESDPSDAAVAGATVTLTANPAENYKLGSFTVTKAGSGTVTVTSTGANTGTFTMPADNVTVSATFTPAYTVTYVANGGSGTMTDPNSPYTASTQVTLLSNTFTYAGHTWSSWLVKNVSTDETITPVEGKFTMPASAVTVTAQWTVGKYNVALSSIANVDLLASYDDKTIDEGENANVDCGTEITLSASNMAAGKVFIWAITDDEDNDVTEDVLDGDILTVPAYDITIGGQVAELFFQYSGELTEGDYIIARNSKAMNTTVSNSKFGTTDISSNLSDGEVVVTNASAYTWHVAKITDTDYWTIMNGSNYAASTGTKSEAQLTTTYDDKCKWTITGTSTYTIVNKYNTANSVNAYLRLNSSVYACYASDASNPSTFYKKVTGSKHTVAIAAGITNGNPSASLSKAYEGQTVALTPNPSSGYMLDSWDVYKTGDATTKITVKNNSFVMPGYDVTVSATYRVQHTYTLVDGSTIKLEAGKHYIIASGGSGTVKVMAEQSGNYRTYIDDVTVTSSQISELDGMYEVVFSGDNTNYWTMYDVNYESFICSTNSGGNITTSPNISDNTKWTVSITDGAATINARAGSAPNFRYNSGSPRFSGYSSAQSPVYLFKKDGDTNLEFHSPTTLASANIASTETYTIESNQVLEVTGALTNNGSAANLVIEDGGQLKLTNGTANVQATMIRDVAAWTGSKGDDDGWYAIASPVNDLEISSFAQGTHNVYSYDEPTAYWHEYHSTLGETPAFSTLISGVGYLYRSTAAGIEFKGVLNAGNSSGNVSPTLSYANSTNNNLKGFNLVGNPFSHNISWSDMTKTDIGEGYYLLDEDPESENRGKWGALTTGTIAPTQAFLVKAASASAALTINNNMPAPSKGEQANSDNIMFSISNGSQSDETFVLFKEGFGLNKISHRNSTIPMLYVIDNGTNYAVATMPDNTQSFMLGFEAKTAGRYTFSFKANGEFNYLHVIDRMTGEDVDMLLEGEYSFIGSPMDNPARFIVRLGYLPNYDDNGEDIFAYQNGSDIVVSGEGELQIFDVMGRMVSAQRVNGVETINLNAQGVYIFKLNEKTQKIVVK